MIKLESSTLKDIVEKRMFSYTKEKQMRLFVESFFYALENDCNYEVAINESFKNLKRQGVL